MADHSLMRLGKRPPKVDSRTLRLARYFTAELAPPPLSLMWTKSVTSFGMMLNDQLGCCTEAGKGHAIQVWTLNTGTMVTVPDSVVLSAYETECGYDPSDSATDQGGVEIDVLNDWRQNGFGGHTLSGYASINPANVIHVRQAIQLFGGTYIGLELPLSAQTQDEWDADSSSNGQPGTWGGHCVFCVGYDADGVWCITWGQLKKMTWAFWNKYCSEAYALWSPDWTAVNCPVGVDTSAWQTDLQLVTN